MMVIGITGGVGSGKSTITGILHEKYGYLVLRTDDMAKELEKPGHAVYDELVRAFGDGILQETGQAGQRPIDKTAFAALIYSDPEAMERAEEIIHPATWSWCEERIAKQRAEKGAGETRIVVESALPCGRFKRMCDEIWFVYAETEIRIGRLMPSRGYSREKCESVIAEQISDEEFISYADYIIDNSGDLEETAERVEELLCVTGREERL